MTIPKNGQKMKLHIQESAYPFSRDISHLSCEIHMLNLYSCSLHLMKFCRFFRVGTIILALHDTSDVFLETAKLFKYSEKEMAASMCFGLFAVSWFMLRIIFFPFWIIKSSSYQSIKSLRMLDPFPMALYYVFNTMLLMLLVFHMYWWKLICAMITRQMSNQGKVGEDIRSDSENED